MLVGAAPKGGPIDPPYGAQRHSFDPAMAGILPVSGNSTASGDVPPRSTLDSKAWN